MIRKFECKNCHHQFEADDAQWVECPQCHSDNVGDVERKLNLKLPTWSKWAALGVLAAALLGGGGYYLWQHYSDNTEEAKTDEAPATAEEFDNSANTRYDGELSPRLVVGEKVYDDRANTYTFEVKVEFPPKEKWRLDICEFRTTKAIASSENGKFEGVPFSTDQLGQYTFRLVDAASGKLLCDELDLVGFDKQITIKKPWKAADLEKAINNYKKTLVDNPYIADGCEIIVTNKAKDDLSDTSTFTSIQQRIELNKKCGTECSVKVEKIEIDDSNRIKSAHISINEKVEDWMNED